MTAKEKQEIVVKAYLKPSLKERSYKTSGNNWWKEHEEFFAVINLQNFSFNSKDRVEFCFNIGIALKKFISDKSGKKISGFDISVPLRENGFISQKRKTHRFRSNIGYEISDETDLTDFMLELKIDFEEFILPKLDELCTIEKCIEFYDQFPLWKEVFRDLAKQNKEFQKSGFS